jgi:hypothetical protein
MFQQDFLGFFWFLSRWQLQVDLKCRVFLSTHVLAFSSANTLKEGVYQSSQWQPVCLLRDHPPTTGLQPANAKRQWPTAFPGRFLGSKLDTS